MHQRRHHVTCGSQLQDYSTSINNELLRKEVLLDVCKRLLERSTYLGHNYCQFLLVLGFCVSRLMRSQHLDDVWGESNMGLIHSLAKNCGKSMTLYLLSKLQGLATRQHPLLLSGGNQSTSGTSAKKILEILSQSTLIVMMDDPLISNNLGEFLNQIQGGLLQGSASSGMYAPKGSILITSNDPEVKRIEGRVQRFTFVRDDDFELDERQEKELMVLAEDNKGLLIAWTMRFMPLWNELSEQFIDVIQRAVRAHFKGEQVRWIRGFAYTIFSKAMFLASVKIKTNIWKTIEEMKASVTCDVLEVLPIMVRFQLAVFEKIKGSIGQVHTWINPFCSVKMIGGETDKAVAFSKEGLNFLSAEISSLEITEFLKKVVVNGVSQPITFAVNASTPLAALRSKKAGDTMVTSRRAHKVPLGSLDPSFIQWLHYALGLTDDQPPEEYRNTPHVDVDWENPQQEEQPSNELREEVSLLEETMLVRVMAFNQDPLNGDNPNGENDLGDMPKIFENLSPASKKTFQTFTPRRKRVYEMGAEAVLRSKVANTKTVGTLTLPTHEQVKPSTLTDVEPKPSCSTTLVEKEAETTPYQPPAKVTMTRTRKQLHFVEGASGVLLSQPVATEDKTSDNCFKCGLKYSKSKKGTQQWVACDKCKNWYHFECSGLKTLPGEQDPWKCAKCM